MKLSNFLLLSVIFAVMLRAKHLENEREQWKKEREEYAIKYSEKYVGDGVREGSEAGTRNKQKRCPICGHLLPASP